METQHTNQSNESYNIRVCLVDQEISLLQVQWTGMNLRTVSTAFSNYIEIRGPGSRVIDLPSN